MEDYLPIHEFMDESKAHFADVRHRALFHSSFGCFLVEKVFGVVKKNSDGRDYSPRDIAEQHVLEDLGRIPPVSDYLNLMKLEPWMGGLRRTREVKLSDETPAETSPASVGNVQAITPTSL